MAHQNAPSITLTYGRHQATSGFDLLGRDENGMTAALGLALFQSPDFLSAFVDLLVPGTGVDDSIAIALQAFGADDRGFSDVELMSPSVHFIVEAKRSWQPPDREQLGRYAGRLAARGRPLQRLVVLTQNAAEAVVRHRLGDWQPDPPARVRVVNWGNLVPLAARATARGDPFERRVARDFGRYVHEVAELQDTHSNKVFVASLTRRPWPGSSITGVEVVEHFRRYFFPATGGPWPRLPPNYVAFRYDGRLQSIHHVDAAEVVDTGGELVPGFDDRWGHPHYVLQLGPPIRPDHPVRTGTGIPRARLAWADIDLLLTSNTISEAEAQTKAREAAAPR